LCLCLCLGLESIADTYRCNVTELNFGQTIAKRERKDNSKENTPNINVSFNQNDDQGIVECIDVMKTS